MSREVKAEERVECPECGELVDPRLHFHTPPGFFGPQNPGDSEEGLSTARLLGRREAEARFMAEEMKKLERVAAAAELLVDSAAGHPSRPSARRTHWETLEFELRAWRGEQP